MRTQRRTFRPFDVPTEIASFLSGSRLRIGESTEYLEAGTQRVVDVTELRAGEFSLEIGSDEASFAAAVESASGVAAEAYGEGAVEFVVVASSGYLKLADVVIRKPLAEVEHITSLKGSGAQGFRAIHHGCDVAALLVLRDQLGYEPLRPWRKATWLSRATFGLRTGLDGIGFTILPLTDEKRVELHLPAKTLRYTALDESPLESSSIATVTLYVHDELLARVKKTPRKNWARAFTDQLAVDVLTAVAVRAVADAEIQDATWDSVRDTLLGSLLVMVGGRPGHDVEQHYSTLLDLLRTNPLAFLARIEGALEMRDSAKLIAGGD